jgi:4-hydroxy-3-methylbut-2-enyl diphosphate reductase
MTFKVIEVDRERRKVVLSNREAAAEEAAARKKETLAKLAEGVIVPGVIRRLTDYGAFVDLGGVDGLLHISEMSWTRIKHPSDILKVGQKIQVMVLKMNMDDNRISLGLRQILPDPWVDVCKKYSVGDVVKGTVTRVVPFGAFVAIEGGVEGIIPNSELAYKRFNRPDDIVSAGQELEVKIIDLRAEERRMSLSLKRMQPAPERPERPERPRREKEESDVDKYRAQQEESGENKTTIGDLLGSQLKDLAVDEAAEAPAEEAAPVVEEAPAAAEAPVEEAPAVEEAPTEEAPAEESAE